jgi:transposase
VRALRGAKLPNDLSPCQVVYQQFRRWLEAMVSNMRFIVRIAQGRPGQPGAVIVDGRTLQSSCESGPCARYDGYKLSNGSKVHVAVDTLGHLIALTVMPASEQECAQVDALCQPVQQATGDTVMLPEARKGFVLLPRRQVVERSFAWLARFRRLSREFERMTQVLAGLHFCLCHGHVSQSCNGPGFGDEFMTRSNFLK